MEKSEEIFYGLWIFKECYIMKTCPNCGSVLADNEPYCENCGFNPDYDGEDWED